jgi:putative nucleotidyltransferase with HDIG domain
MSFGRFLGINFVFITLMLILVISILFNRQIRKGINGYFLLIIVVAGIYAVFFNIELIQSESQTYQVWRRVASAINYVSKAALFYCIIMLSLRDVWKRWLKLVIIVPLLIQVLLSVSMPLSRIFVYFDELNRFHSGPFHRLAYFVIAVYIVIMLVSTFHYRHTDIGECMVIVGVCALLVFDVLYEALFYVEGVNFDLSVIAIAIIGYYLYFMSNDFRRTIQTNEIKHAKVQEEKTDQMLQQVVELLAYTIDVKDTKTNGHSWRVAEYARQIAARSGLSEEDCIGVYYGGLLHDIGKIGISESIINKKGNLTAEEYEQIKNHPEYGANILKHVSELPYLEDAARYHHERYDGKGYQKGLAGEEIPRIARIIAVADSYDAMTSRRDYHQPMSQARVRKEIVAGSGTQFDPWYARIMLQMIDEDTAYKMREEAQQDIQSNSFTA